MPQDWFSQFTAKPRQARQDPAGDWFAQFTAPAAPLVDASGQRRWNPATQPFTGQPARAEDFMPPQPEGSALGRFGSSAWEMVNPVTIVKGAVQAVRHPIDTATGILSAHAERGRKALAAAQHGRVSEALGHGAATLLPIVGPVAANIGEQIGSGDVAGGLGAATGLLTAAVAPGAAVRAARNARVPAILPNRSPVAAAAVEAGQRAGVPIDAATATGNRAVGAIQHMADRSLGGSLISEKAAEAQAQGLATMGEQLAAKGYRLPVTAEQAGTGAREAVVGQVAKHGDEATQAYSKLRAFEADPAYSLTVKPALKGSAAAEGALVPRMGRFAKEGASTDDLFQGVLGDARRNGFTGSADDLKVEFVDRLRSAKELGKEIAATTSETGPRALLADIRRLGGLKPGGDLAVVSEGFGSRNGWGQQGAARIIRRDGLGVDDMLDQLKQDPKWQGAMRDWTDHDLVQALDDIAREGPAAAGSSDFEHLLRATGVEPGARWWSEGAGKAGTRDVPLAVDLTGARQALEPIYSALKREAELVPLMGDKGRALTALDRLMRGPEWAQLSSVDAALGDLKSFARADIPELRTAGQGAVAQAVKQLDAVVRQTAAAAGPEVLEALEAGRKATVSKYRSADVLEKLHATEGVKSFRGVTAPKDSAIGQLRDLAREAPAELPKIGRAYLDDLLEQASSGPEGFAHGAKIANDWQKLGAETKRLLYKDPAYVRDLDNFFHLARLTAKNANPSGTAHAMAALHTGGTVTAALTGAIEPITAVAALAGPAAVSKFLHSAAGVRILTKGFRIPLGNKTARTAYASELAGFAQRIGATNPSGSQPAVAGAR